MTFTINCFVRPFSVHGQLMSATGNSECIAVRGPTSGEWLVIPNQKKNLESESKL